MKKDDAILAKTAKGVCEALGKTSALPRGMRNLFKEVDGKTSFGDLLQPATTTDQTDRHAAGEMAKREAREAARKTAEEQVRRIAEARARRKAKEPARKAAAQVRQEAEERAKREAEAAARKVAEEQARRKAEERAKREALERAKREAEEQARRKAEERKRRPAMAMAGSSPRTRPKWGKMLALALAVPAIAMAVLANTLSFDSRIPEFERAASAQFGQPVKISALQASYLPRPQWRFEGVVIGAANQISVPRITAEPRSYAELLGGSTTLASMRIEAPVINAEGLDWLLFGKAQAPGLATRSLVATQVRLDLPGVVVPVFDAQLDIGGDGNWQRIETTDAESGLRIQLSAGDSMQVAIKLDKAALPLFRTPVFDDLTATGMLDRHGLRIGKFEGFSHGGTFTGSAALPWGSGASLAGTVSISTLDMAQVLPGLVETGRLAWEGSFSLPLGDKALPQLAGTFSIDKATLNGIDFGRWLRGESGGQTQFDTLTGTIRQQGGRTRLSQLSGDAGRLAVRGGADIDEKGDASGRFSIELGGERHRGTAVLRGPARVPYKELKWERR